MGLVQILPNLLSGSLPDVKQTSELLKFDVKAILTVDQRPLPAPFHESFSCKHFLLLDLDEEDLLSKLLEAIKFIESFRMEGNAVVVHW